MMLQRLEEWDQQLFRWLNAANNEFFDFLMPWISDKYVWIPLYALLLFWMIKYNLREWLFVVLGIGVLIFLSDQATSGILKPWVARLRPCHEPALAGEVQAVDGCGGLYGFASSHASNMFAVATFSWLLLKTHLKYIWLLFPWAGLIAYSRIYLGVHYPGDVIVGAIIGILAGFITKWLFDIAARKLKSKN